MGGSYIFSVEEEPLGTEELSLRHAEKLYPENTIVLNAIHSLVLRFQI